MYCEGHDGSEDGLRGVLVLEGEEGFGGRVGGAYEGMMGVGRVVARWGDKRFDGQVAWNARRYWALLPSTGKSMLHACGTERA